MSITPQSGRTITTRLGLARPQVLPPQRRKDHARQSRRPPEHDAPGLPPQVSFPLPTHPPSRRRRANCTVQTPCSFHVRGRPAAEGGAGRSTGATGTKVSCNQGGCGACTVMLSTSEGGKVRGPACNLAHPNIRSFTDEPSLVWKRLRPRKLCIHDESRQTRLPTRLEALVSRDQPPWVAPLPSGDPQVRERVPAPAALHGRPERHHD